MACQVLRNFERQIQTASNNRRFNCLLLFPLFLTLLKAFQTKSLEKI